MKWRNLLVWPNAANLWCDTGKSRRQPAAILSLQVDVPAVLWAASQLLQIMPAIKIPVNILALGSTSFVLWPQILYFRHSSRAEATDSTAEFLCSKPPWPGRVQWHEDSKSKSGNSQQMLWSQIPFTPALSAANTKEFCTKNEWITKLAWLHYRHPKQKQISLSLPLQIVSIHKWAQAVK